MFDEKFEHSKGFKKMENMGTYQSFLVYVCTCSPECLFLCVSVCLIFSTISVFTQKRNHTGDTRSYPHRLPIHARLCCPLNNRLTYMLVWNHIHCYLVYYITYFAYYIHCYRVLGTSTNCCTCDFIASNVIYELVKPNAITMRMTT